MEGFKVIMTYVIVSIVSGIILDVISRIYLNIYVKRNDKNKILVKVGYYTTMPITVIIFYFVTKSFSSLNNIWESIYSVAINNKLFFVVYAIYTIYAFFLPLRASANYNELYKYWFISEEYKAKKLKKLDIIRLELLYNFFILTIISIVLRG